MNEINKALFNKKILAFDSKTGRYSWVSPKILTTTIFNEKGENLDDLLKFTPAELVKMVEDILEGAPEAYDTFLEVSKGLEGNKSSITSLFKAIDKKVSMPTENKVPGYVLKLDKDLNIVFAEDNDTVYEHPVSHSADMIKESIDKNFVSEKEKETWDAKLDGNSDLSENEIKYRSEKMTMTEFLDLVNESFKDLDESKGQAGGIATLDEAAKVPVDQLPAEALKDTTYDLSPYLLTDDAVEIFALKTELPVVDLSPYAKTEDLDAYAKTEDLDNYQLLEKRGAVDGYASLGEDGKVPKEQIDFDDFNDFVKNKDLEYATIEDIADLMI